MHEIAMKLGDDLRVLEDDLGDERSSLQIPASFELEHVTFGTDHRSGVEAFNERCSLRSCIHGYALLATPRLSHLRAQPTRRGAT
jgi:hypothetical protein